MISAASATSNLPLPFLSRTLKRAGMPVSSCKKTSTKSAISGIGLAGWSTPRYSGPLRSLTFSISSLIVANSSQVTSPSPSLSKKAKI